MIDCFRGAYAFLSNFHPSPLVYAGRTFATVEHLYQASKASRLEDYEAIRLALTPAEAKRLGRSIVLRPGWEEGKLRAMAGCLKLKFAEGSVLATSLLATGEAELVEGNTWGDTVWGVCRGVGHNHLGRLLMARRDELRTLGALDRPAGELFCVCGARVPREHMATALTTGITCGACGTQLSPVGLEKSRGLRPEIGSRCPICKQKIKKLNPHRMDVQKWRVLTAMARLHRQGAEWVKTEEGRELRVGDTSAETAYRAGAHVGRLKWFGLVDHQGPRTAMYRVNDAGYGFLAGRLSVPEVIYCREGVVVDAAPERVFVWDIKDVILDKSYWDDYPNSEARFTRGPAGAGPAARAGSD